MSRLASSGHNRSADAAHPCLDAELDQALHRADDERLAYLLNALNLPLHRVPVGVAFVAIAGDRYFPDPNANAAIILPVEENARLVDLCCCRLVDRCTALRVGDGRFLGMVWCQRAVVRGERLIVHSDPLAWLHRGAVGVVVVDWRGSLPLLFNTKRILCDNETLARRLQGGLAILGTFPEIAFAQRANV
jgi:hypothetical protein